MENTKQNSNKNQNEEHQDEINLIKASRTGLAYIFAYFPYVILALCLFNYNSDGISPEEETVKQFKRVGSVVTMIIHVATNIVMIVAVILFCKAVNHDESNQAVNGIENNDNDNNGNGEEWNEAVKEFFKQMEIAEESIEREGTISGVELRESLGVKEEQNESLLSPCPDSTILFPSV